ncbi:MAG: (2Fe-2S)-binding protein [Candidatus Saccharibacteria bacterium]|nr:(2Fe-2S)-binding protein [Rhodoferax sp.]
MIVCVCHRVSDKSIVQHALEGKGFDDIQFELGVASQCGRCEDCARDIIDACHAQSGAAQHGWQVVSLSLNR